MQRIACIGGAHIDRHALLQAPFVPATSNPCNITASFGGVARNVAENLARLGVAVSLVSRVGDDEPGRALITHLDGLGVGTSMVTIAPRPTASYTAILQPDGELVLGLADMEIYDELNVSSLDLGRLRECRVWFADANIPKATLEHLAENGPLCVDAVSVPKSRKLDNVLLKLSIVFTNLAQAEAIAGARFCDAVAAARALHQLGAKCGIVTQGAAGVAAWTGDDIRSLAAFPAHPKDVTGAGDSLIAGTLLGLTGGLSIFDAARLGLAAAAITVESCATVAENLTAERLNARMAAHLH